MIDIHAHILPGLDDGAADLEESIRMLRLAEEQGVHKIIAPPFLVSFSQCQREGTAHL